MFNLNKYKESQVSPTEKYLRKDNLGPEADDKQSITEKEVPHRTGDKDTITEDHIQDKHTTASDSQIIEKVLNEAQSYVVHRAEPEDHIVPPDNVLVEKTRQERLEDFETVKESHWRQTYNEKEQFGDLPKRKKNAPQHDKIVLNNDPKRFKGDKVKPLTGTITTADVDTVAYKIKTGKSIDFDTAIVAILREADKEERELTTIEQKTIADLKIARTNSLMIK